MDKSRTIFLDVCMAIAFVLGLFVIIGKILILAA